MPLLNHPWIFEIGAEIYAWFNSQSLWRKSCARLAVFFPPPRPDQPLRVLDLGCGPGVTAIELARARPDAIFVGLDLAARMLKVARGETRKANLSGAITYVLADATALPFATNVFDVTTGHSFLYLVPDRVGVLKEAFRVVRPGGRYVSMEPREGQVDSNIVRKNWTNLRFMISILLWRPYSKYHGRLDESSFPARLKDVGFRQTGTELALGGLGIIGYGEK